MLLFACVPFVLSAEGFDFNVTVTIGGDETLFAVPIIHVHDGIGEGTTAAAVVFARRTVGAP